MSYFRVDRIRVYYLFYFIDAGENLQVSVLYELDWSF